VANSRLHEVWHGTASGSSYPQLFGQQSYVKDGSDPQLLSLLSEAVSKAPELQGTALGQHVAMGKVGPEDIQILQSFLESKGYSVGGPGVDGKYGPLTHSALERFLDGQPPDPQTARPGASGQPRQTVAA
jgi:peptidoglycan hydrolase-like protein with peptidoglycan-binding domain